MIDMQRYWGDRCIYYPYELTSKIIQKMQSHGEVVLNSKENRDPVSSGLYGLLDQLCDFWKWDKSKITIITTVDTVLHPEYTIKIQPISHAACFSTAPLYHAAWNQEKYYGVFVGRATAIRTYAIQKHLEFKYRNLGLTTFNDSLVDNNDHLELLDYFVYSGKTYNDLKSLTPYNDLGPVVKPPILPPHNVSRWEEIYRRIGVEIVCETSAHIDFSNQTFHCSSEKLFRPMLNKKPFFLLGSRGTVNQLRDVGFSTFEEYFGNYHMENNFRSLDMIFDILEHAINDGTFVDLIEKSKEGAEQNYRKYINIAQQNEWDIDTWETKWKHLYPEHSTNKWNDNLPASPANSL